MAMTMQYRVTATLNNVECETTLSVSDHYALTGMSEREATLLIDNTFENYSEFYQGDDSLLEAEWVDIEITFVGAW